MIDKYLCLLLIRYSTEFMDNSAPQNISDKERYTKRRVITESAGLLPIARDRDYAIGFYSEPLKN